MNNFNEKQKRTEKRKWQEIRNNNNKKIPEERKKGLRVKKWEVSERGMEKKHGEWVKSARSATSSPLLLLCSI